MLELLTVIIISLFLAFFSLSALISILDRANVMDEPTARGLHSKAVPRGGGIVFSLLLFIILLSLNSFEYYVLGKQILALLLAGSVISLTGFFLFSYPLYLYELEINFIPAFAALLSPFVIDASLTLFKRFLSGEKWHQANESHAFQ